MRDMRLRNALSIFAEFFQASPRRCKRGAHASEGASSSSNARETAGTFAPACLTRAPRGLSAASPPRRDENNPARSSNGYRCATHFGACLDTAHLSPPLRIKTKRLASTLELIDRASASSDPVFHVNDSKKFPSAAAWIATNTSARQIRRRRFRPSYASRLSALRQKAWPAAVPRGNYQSTTLATTAAT